MAFLTGKTSISWKQKWRRSHTWTNVQEVIRCLAQSRKIAKVTQESKYQSLFRLVVFFSFFKVPVFMLMMEFPTGVAYL